MYSRAAVLVGFAGLASLAAAASPTTCTQSTITITAAAQATLDCDIVPGTILVQGNDITTMDLSGPSEVGSLVVDSCINLVSLGSTTVTKIGLFNMTELNTLSSLNLPALQSVSTINWIALDQLSAVTFGADGVTKVSRITISDTFLSTLDGLNVATVDSVNINNNRKLISWTSDLLSVSDSLTLTSNGNGAMVVNMPKLAWVSQMDIRNVKEFDAPVLQAVNQSMRFNENEMMTAFSAPNLTSVSEIAFTNNNQLTEINYPKLTETGGPLTLQNNTALEQIIGFPKLQTVRGTFILRGSFNNASFPDLSNVIGGGIITSTQDITSTCDFFDKLHEEGDIQGDGYACTSNNTQANSGGTGGSSNGDGGGSGGDDSAAAALPANFLFALGVAVFGGLSLL